MSDGRNDDEPREAPAEITDARLVRRRRIVVCRECTAVFLTSIDSQTKWGTVCMPCLRAMGCV